MFACGLALFTFCCSLVWFLTFGCVRVFKQEREVDPEGGEEGVEETSTSHLQRLKTTVTKLFQLNQAIRQLHSCLTTALRGEASDMYTSWGFSSGCLCRNNSLYVAKVICLLALSLIFSPSMSSYNARLQCKATKRQFNHLNIAIALCYTNDRITFPFCKSFVCCRCLCFILSSSVQVKTAAEIWSPRLPRLSMSWSPVCPKMDRWPRLCSSPVFRASSLREMSSTLLCSVCSPGSNRQERTAVLPFQIRAPMMKS